MLQKKPLPLGEMISEQDGKVEDLKSTVHSHEASNMKAQCAANIAKTLMQVEVKTDMNHETLSSANFMSLLYPISYLGLVTPPCHGLVDTCAQDGVIGLWHFQRWCALLAQQHGLRPLFEPIPPNLVAGGIGGSAKTLGIAEVPVGLAGVNGTCRFVILEDPCPENATPPLIPINYLKKVDAVIRPKHEIMTLAGAGKTTKLVSIPRTQHQTTSMMKFSEEGWMLPDDRLERYVKKYGGNPFGLRLDGTALGHDPKDPRLDPFLLKDQVHRFANQKALDALESSHTSWDSEPGETLAANCVSILSFLSSGDLPNAESEAEKGRSKNILRVKVGDVDRIPKELKHLDTSKQVSKHKFPQDRWERHPGCWVRVHTRPRKSLFIPTGTKDGPNINDLDRNRVTDIRFCDDDKTETIRDQWMSSGGRSRTFKKRWTGCSIFQLKV